MERLKIIVGQCRDCGPANFGTGTPSHGTVGTVKKISVFFCFHNNIIIKIIYVGTCGTVGRAGAG